jgi:putative ABC transport system substrate-binding protein
LPSLLAAKAATTTIPIVFEVASDPVELGLVNQPFARPSGNITGVTSLNAEVQPKRLELAARAGAQHASADRDFDAVFATLVQPRAGALVIGADPLFTSRLELLMLGLYRGGHPEHRFHEGVRSASCAGA